jgi:hypothetical protein
VWSSARWSFVLGAVLVSSAAAAFPHVVQEGESAAQLAERVYGRVELERVIVAANGLDGRGGSAIVAGMRLELPAVGHHLVLPGETWQSLASDLLGSAKRGDILAQLNGSQPWLQPAVGREIILPFNLRYVATQGDTTQTVAYRFLGNRERAWVVASYNGLTRARLRQGEVLLVPLTELALTEAGRREAVNAEALVRSQAGGQAREAQRQAEHKIPELVSDVRRGRYVEAIRRGEGLLASGGLSRPQLGVIHRQLTEAYAALDAVGLAATECGEWRRADPKAVLDPIDLSPKLMRACLGEPGSAPSAAPPDRSASPSPSSSAAAGAATASRSPTAASTTPTLPPHGGKARVP